GLVLVHGVGEQGRGTTLLTWLDTIVGTVEAATVGGVSVEVERAALGGGSGPGGASPPHALLRLRGEGVDARRARPGARPRSRRRAPAARAPAPARRRRGRAVARGGGVLGTDLHRAVVRPARVVGRLRDPV